MGNGQKLNVQTPALGFESIIPHTDHKNLGMEIGKEYTQVRCGTPNRREAVRDVVRSFGYDCWLHPRSSQYLIVEGKLTDDDVIYIINQCSGVV